MSVKKHIVDCMKLLYKSKYISMRDGNVSFKPKNSNYFYISAGSIKKNEINEDQVIKVNFKKSDMIFPNKLNYDIDYNKNYKYQPSREILMHSFLQTDKIYDDEDVFVVHAHPPNIISYIGINKSNELKNIKNIFPEINVGEIGDNVKYHHAGSYDLAKDCYDKLTNNEIIGLERHGSLSIGSDIEQIMENIETLEYYIDIKLKSNE